MDPTSNKIALGAAGATGASGPYNGDVVLAGQGTPFIRVAPFNSSTGFGTKYADPSVALSTTNSIILAAKFTQAGTDIIFTERGSTTAQNQGGAIRFIPGVGFGTLYTKPTTTSNLKTKGVEVGPQDASVLFLLENNTAPVVDAFPFTSGTGFGSKYTAPTTSLNFGSLTQKFDLNKNGTALALTAFASGGRSILQAIRWSNATGFGTKYTDPSALAGETLGRAVAFNNANTAIALGYNNSSLLTAFQWSDASGFGTQYTAPASALPGTPLDIDFSPSDKAVAVALFGSPYIIVYPWTDAGGFGTPYSNPSTLPVTNSKGVTFSPDGAAVIVCGESASFRAYSWADDTGFGTVYSNPSSFAFTNNNAVSFGPAR